VPQTESDVTYKAGTPGEKKSAAAAPTETAAAGKAPSPSQPKPDELLDKSLPSAGGGDAWRPAPVDSENAGAGAGKTRDARTGANRPKSEVGSVKQLDAPGSSKETRANDTKAKDTNDRIERLKSSHEGSESKDGVDSGPAATAKPGARPAPAGAAGDDATDRAPVAGGGAPAATGGLVKDAKKSDDALELSLVENTTGARGPATKSDGTPSGRSTGRAAGYLRESVSGESYAIISENPFEYAAVNGVSTVSVDVDTASYANVRRYLEQNTLPPHDAVRIEEFINYFPYQRNSVPTQGAPFSVQSETAAAPWQPGHQLLRIALQVREIPAAARQPANLVFLVDVSESMADADKLPLLKQSLALLVARLREGDRVSIVTYAGTSGVALRPTDGSKKAEILKGVDSLVAGGGTNGSAGIQQAYEMASVYYNPNIINRVILCTDGDFNVGITDHAALVKLVAEKAKDGVFLSVLGFGKAHLQEARMETLADRGNGHFAYIDSLREAQKALVEPMTGTLATIAKDVKVQVAFNPLRVSAYRLLGYENRVPAREDFSKDREDAGDVGAGHHVVFLYEIEPAATPASEAARLTLNSAPADVEARLRETFGADGLCNVAIRYREPVARESSLLQYSVRDGRNAFSRASSDFQFTAAVAAFALWLRDSVYKGSITPDLVLELARGNTQFDPGGHRAEFLKLVERARTLSRLK
jgi:secreted protein with Ig-like and vWFA domain